MDFETDFTVEMFGLDQSKQDRRNARAEEAFREVQQAVRQILDNPTTSAQGLRLLNWMIDQTGVFRPSFTGNSETFYREGRRAVGLELYRLLLAADASILQRLINFRKEDQRDG